MGVNNAHGSELKPLTFVSSLDSSTQGTGAATGSAPAVTTTASSDAAQGSSDKSSATSSDQKSSTTKTAAQKAGVKDSEFKILTNKIRYFKLINDTQDKAALGMSADKSVKVKFELFNKDGSVYKSTGALDQDRNNRDGVNGAGGSYIVNVLEHDVAYVPTTTTQIPGNVYIKSMTLYYKNYEPVTFKATGMYAHPKTSKVVYHYNFNNDDSGKGEWKVYPKKMVNNGREDIVVHLYHRVGNNKSLVSRQIAHPVNKKKK